ncbi:hypothetical protein [Gloeobacter kilaueensis]|uniref:Uncharacterized protein n=1 Tax=Gloeobacter kilaueensis (strain ATCC BAA-2537 / CCAP 1431/1 / ULC 316 / JS1) TaxID=1183438 RepID=U5QH96_GLOK1|nr:hypothetical protein [Gloeobacter kilaueensis]AGY57035.1 hypothetical protein GKIL_0789 [Gloeobacter kilaueensis JS1]
MTSSNGQPENWRERLERVEALTAANSEQIAANSAAIARLETAQATSNQRMDDLTERVNVLSERMTDLTERVGILSERVSDLTRMVEQVSRIALATFQRMDAMQSEIRGLQTENQRILDVLQRLQGE